MASSSVRYIAGIRDKGTADRVADQLARAVASGLGLIVIVAFLLLVAGILGG